MSLAVHDKGIDYAYSHPSPASIKASGAQFVLRYSAGVASDPANPSHHLNAGKLITPGEFRALLAAGLDVIANSEWYEERVTEGAAAGRADGAADYALWRACGLARDASIYVSWDADPNPSHFNGVAAYLAAYRAALNGYYHPDLYAGDPAIVEMKRRGLIRYGWRTNADSWSHNGYYYRGSPDAVAKVTSAHIWQDGNVWYGGTADQDTILRLPVGSHRETLPITGDGAEEMALSSQAVAQVTNIVEQQFHRFFSLPDKNGHWADHNQRDLLANGIAPVAALLADPHSGLLVRVAAVQAALAAQQSELAGLLAEVKALQSGAVAVNPSTVPVTGTLNIGAQS